MKLKDKKFFRYLVFTNAVCSGMLMGMGGLSPRGQGFVDTASKWITPKMPRWFRRATYTYLKIVREIVWELEILGVAVKAYRSK